MYEYEAALPRSSEELRLRVFRAMGTRRYLHTLGVEREATRLAQRFGLNVDHAQKAGLLHDITKCAENQLHLCSQYDIIPTMLEETAPKLLHAHTGAAIARQWGMPEEVCSAIRWHTTGRAGMSELEKVLYLADFVEPFREDIPGLRELRAILENNGLDHAMARALALTIGFTLKKKRALLHPASVEALNDYRARL